MYFIDFLAVLTRCQTIFVDCANVLLAYFMWNNSAAWGGIPQMRGYVKGIVKMIPLCPVFRFV